MGRPTFGLCCVGILALLISCEAEKERAPGFEGTFGDGPPRADCEAPPAPDVSTACTSETIALVGRKPTVYFVLDVSGSMLDYIPQGGDTKLHAAKTALATVLQEIGHRTRYGLATFPGPNSAEGILGCAPGEEVFEVQEGDPLECINQRPSGPVYTSFVRKLSRIEASGGTPLSPTLDALYGDLVGSENQTTVVLITDGAPNCNDEYQCEAENCAYNRYGVTRFINGDDLPCEDPINCCSEEDTGFADAHLQCVDEPASVAAIEALSTAGIPTYVIGVLGTQDFDDVMNELAEAGGKARSGTRKYYDVASLSELTDAVRSIGTDLTQTCEIELEQPPYYEDQFNVYFDGDVVPRDPEDGWTLEEGVVTLHGNACDEMKSGAFEQVYFLAGCQTVVR